MPGRCGSRSHGGFCTQRPIKGIDRCRMHAGMSLSKAKAKGAVVAEVLRWGLGDTTVDPGEVLLRLVSQSAARCALYARLLEEAYDAAERLARAGTAPRSDVLAEETARLDLERIFNTGGVGVLIGHKYSGTQANGVIATGEAIRGLVELEAGERDRCANFATKAIAAGLAERQVRLAEKQGALLAAVIQAVFADPEIGATAGQMAALPAVLQRVVASMTGSQLAVGGSAA